MMMMMVMMIMRTMMLTMLELSRQVSLAVKLSTILPSTPLHRRVSQAVTTSPARGAEMTARRLGRANWSSVVNILLVEGRDLLAMDEEGTSDPYCKFR